MRIPSEFVDLDLCLKGFILHLSDRNVKGSLEHFDEIKSERAATRTVEVWLPPGYFENPDRRLPVLYMHDGQNLFEARHSFSGISWGMDEAVVRSMDSKGHDGIIIVGIWNTPNRIPEYMPQRPLERIQYFRKRMRFARTYGDHACSDDYLWFIVNELKPKIDKRYRTLTGQKHTYMMGSSMGALVTLYGLCEFPHVFSNVACLSTSWTVVKRIMLSYLQHHIPSPKNHRIYFDYGIEAHIGAYKNLQQQVNNLFRFAGFRQEDQFLARHFPGATHSEVAWRERVDIPLDFLLSDWYAQTERLGIDERIED